MKYLILTIIGVALTVSALAQAPAGSNNGYPTRMENLLHQTGTVITSTSRPLGTVEGKAVPAETNNLTVRLRAETINSADRHMKEYGVALQIENAREWRSRTIYIDGDELDKLVVGINKLLTLQPELPLVQARYETRGGLIVGTYSTEKREVLARLEILNDDSCRLKMGLDTLKDFRDLVVSAKSNIDLLKTDK